MQLVRLILLSKPVEASQARAFQGHVKAAARRAGLGQVLRFSASRPIRLVPLTRRQTEVLRGIATGLSTREIAHTLSISVKTVETHRTAIIQRLGINTVAGLVRYALQSGTLPVSWILG